MNSATPVVEPDVLGEDRAESAEGAVHEADEEAAEHADRRHPVEPAEPQMDLAERLRRDRGREPDRHQRKRDRDRGQHEQSEARDLAGGSSIWPMVTAASWITM